MVVRDLWNDLSEDVTWIVKLGVDKTNPEVFNFQKWGEKKKPNDVDTGTYMLKLVYKVLGWCM